MGKSRDLFKKIGDIKGIFFAKMSTVKDRNCKTQTEMEEIKKRWQNYMKRLYKTGLNDPNNLDGGITHIVLDTLECEVSEP